MTFTDYLMNVVWIIVLGFMQIGAGIIIVAGFLAIRDWYVNRQEEYGDLFLGLWYTIGGLIMFSIILYFFIVALNLY